MFTYLLALDQGKFYVGRTRDLDKRFRQHWTKKGALWTKRYEPQNVIWICDGDIEKELTLHAMRIFGLDNVRGGPYTSLVVKRPKLRSHDGKNDRCLGKENLAIMSVSTTMQTDLKAWSISDALKNKYNSSEFHIFTKGTKVHPRVQLVNNKLPMRCPFGVSQFNDQGTLSINFCVAPYMDDVKQFLSQVDLLILDWCWENKAAVFGNKIPTSREIMENMYNPVLIPGKNGLDPLIRCKISQSCPVWVVKDEGTTKGTLEDVQPHSSCVPVLSFDKIWCMAGRFGCTVRVQGLLCYPRKEQTLQDLFPSFEPMEE